MSRATFVLVKGGHLHRNPAFEDCNVDDAEVINRYHRLEDAPSKAVACSKCRPRGEMPEGLAEDGVEPTPPTAPEANEASAPPTEEPEKAEVKPAAKDK